jgi:hypothetical protein
MDAVQNPYAPVAGTPPPELAGREELREAARVALARICAGKPSKSLLMVGLRGVGKTVLLDKMREDAEAAGLRTIRVEAPENRSLPAILAPQLRIALLQLSRDEKAKDLAQRALRGLAGFAKALKLKYQDIEVGFDFRIRSSSLSKSRTRSGRETNLSSLFELEKIEFSPQNGLFWLMRAKGVA